MGRRKDLQAAETILPRRRSRLRPALVLVAAAGSPLAAVGPVPLTIAAVGAVVVISLAGLIHGRRRLGRTLVAVAQRWYDPLLLTSFGVLVLGGTAVSVCLVPGRPGHQLTGSLLLVALPAVLLGVWGLLYERIRDDAIDAVRESLLVSLGAGVLTWTLVVEQVWVDHRVGAPEALLPLGGAVLAVVGIVTSVRLALTPGRVGAGIWLAAAFTALLGAAVSLLGSELMGGTDVEPPVRALVVAAIGLFGIAGAHRSIGPLRMPLPPSPVRMGPARLLVVVVVGLQVPIITTWRLVTDQAVSVPSVVAGTVILSLAVIAYLAGLVREWARLEQRVQHDELTGLPNRRAFNERLAIAIADAQRTGALPGVLFLDLDRFKVVNDSLGHAAGNQLLMSAARRIRDAVPDDAVVARLQGDEFAVLVADGGQEVSVAVAGAILGALAAPISMNGRTTYVTASVGVACYPEDGVDHEELLRSADTAMYQAKDRGRNNAQVHTPELRSRAIGRFDIETALHEAIARDELRVLYQPRVDLRTGQVAGAEALLRWRHHQLGPIPPSQFIPIAEETGLITSIGEWVLERACEQLKSWQEAGFPQMTVSVNLSPRQFELGRIPDVVARVLRRTGLDGRRLEVELTERLALADVDGVTAMLRELREMGVCCSIDDFGIGYSGLSYLGRFPLSALKIDKSFVAMVAQPGEGASGESIVRGVIALARSLGLRVIAEGVETRAQLRFLIENGCDEMQGYLFSPPVTPDRFESLVMLERVAAGRGRIAAMADAVAPLEAASPAVIVLQN